MLKISKEQARKRWDRLSETLKEALFSDINTDAVWQISKEHHISEDKIPVIALNVGDVILGFISIDELPKEIGISLNLDNRIALDIAQELEKRIFFGIREEIVRNYDPVNAFVVKAEKEKISNGAAVSLQEKIVSSPIEKTIPIKADLIDKIKTEEEKPLIIHEEKMPASIAEIQKQRRGFSLPFKFFQSKSAEPETKPAVKVQIETPEKKKDGAKKVVHYSEFRTAVAPFEEQQETISLKREGGSEIKSETARKETADKNSKPESNPKLNGNIVDLR